MAAVTRAKKRLGTFLVQQRDGAGRSLADAADELKASESTVSRYESGQVLPVWSTVLTLLRYYGSAQAVLDRATHLWESAKDAAPPVRLPAGTHRTFRQLVNAEHEADTERTIERSVIPGMLQTEGYIRSLVAAAQRVGEPSARAEAVVATRRSRQERLTGSDPLWLHAIIDEAAILRQVGTPEVMREQLEHLLAVGERPNITVQVVPFGAGAYGTASGAFIIVDYPGDSPGVYLEYPAGGAWVENEDDVGRLIAMFEDSERVALSPADTAKRLRQQLGALDADEQQHEVAQE